MGRVRWALSSFFVFAACSESPGGGSELLPGLGEPCTGACAPGLECRPGAEKATFACVPPCAGETTACGPECCAAGARCEARQCVADLGCPLGRVSCGEVCCASEEVCEGGACVCPAPCGASCCGAGQVCDQARCTTDCGGGVPGCGAAGACCDAGEVCHLGACVRPGAPCSGASCATRPEEGACPRGEVCDVTLGRCLPLQPDESCVYVPPVGLFDPVPSFTWGRRLARSCARDADCQKAEVCTAGTCAVTWPHLEPAADDAPDHVQVTSTPMVADLDGDCVPEIVFNTYAGSVFNRDGVLRAIRGDDGRKVWTVDDPAYRTDSTANPAIGDVDGDGRPEVFVAGQGRYVLRIEGDGTPGWISESFSGPNNSGSVALANMDGEGDAEIVFGAVVFDSRGRIVFEGLAGRGIGGQGPISCVADLDGDGRPELIAGHTVYATEGSVPAGTFAGQVRWTAETPDGYCGVADLTGDGAPEVVLVASGRVYVLQGQTGAILAQAAIPGGGHGGAPNIADFDGDGRMDIGTAGQARYVVYRFEERGALPILWQATIEDDSSHRTGSSVFDFDGDGRAEVVYNDEVFLRIYPGVEPDCRRSPPGPGCDGVMTDAEILFFDLNSSRTRTEYPVIADVDGDFKAEIVFSTSNEAAFLDPLFLGDAGIEVWGDRLDNWVTTRPIWNQHGYHITNVSDAAAIPRREAPSWASAATNGYRRNAQGERETFCAPDLVVRELGQDTAACPELRVRVVVANQGCLGVGAGVAVALFDESGALLAVGRTTAAIGPGGAEAVTVSVMDLGDDFRFGVRAVVDDDGAGRSSLNECREDNNTSEVLEVACRFDL